MELEVSIKFKPPTNLILNISFEGVVQMNRVKLMADPEGTECGIRRDLKRFRGK
jgi:hypothetical protein